MIMYHLSKHSSFAYGIVSEQLKLYIKEQKNIGKKIYIIALNVKNIEINIERNKKEEKKKVVCEGKLNMKMKCY